MRRYVPELRLADERAAVQVTVRNLLNHTADLGVRLIVETGDGDDALAGYVAKMTELEVIAPPGTRPPWPARRPPGPAVAPSQSSGSLG